MPGTNIGLQLGAELPSSHLAPAELHDGNIVVFCEAGCLPDAEEPRRAHLKQLPGISMARSEARIVPPTRVD